MTVPLPAVQQSSVETLTVKATARAGKTVGKLHVQTANDAALGNLSVVYVVQAPKTASAHETLTVSVFIKRFFTRRVVSHRDAGGVLVHIETADGDFLAPLSTKGFNRRGTSCSVLKNWDQLFESGAEDVLRAGATLSLYNGRSEKAQPSPLEEVLDNVLAGVKVPAGCDWKPEGDDPGNT